MTMVYASPPPRRARNRDSQAHVDTQVYVRRTPHAWRNVFLQPWMPDDPPLPWATPATPPVTLPATPATPRASREGRRRRSKMPWVVFLAAFGIAFGIGKDRELRAELVSELRVATARTLAVLETSAMKLGRQVAEPR
jgi:hypothetical protein